MKMVNYIKYSDAGEVLMTGSMLDTMLAGQEGNFMEGNARIGLDYIHDGAVLSLPELPSSFHEFDYQRQQWVLNAELAWIQIRCRRYALMAQTDWVVMRATDQGQPIPAQWKAYRQALRDITEQPDPCAIEWPSMPT